ncbi:MAG: hypothetical protein KJZ56_11345 [Flavobacteriales bacterium]|nr:hypothetical protein [Flavobacteriales bacterium]
MKNKILLILFSVLLFSACSRKQYVSKVPERSHSNDTIVKMPTDIIYKKETSPSIKHTYEINPEIFYVNAFHELKEMLEEKRVLSFKRAVFITENAYFENLFDYKIFSNYISILGKIATQWNKSNKLINYKNQDSLNMALNGAIFRTLTDTIFNADSSLINVPYIYDFDDCFAKADWENMFVTKLLATHKGNCHSLPFLYKLVAEELKVKAWLSFTPNHIYIRNYSKKTSWYNTEMTNAMFPTEAWVMTSGYVSVNSIVSGIYMDTLGLKQSVVVCVNDLAKGYLRKFKNPDLQFVLNCCDLGLKYYPNYAELLLLKAETHKKMYQNYVAKYGLNVQNSTDPHSEKVKYHLSEMNKSYGLLAEYDYREIPEEMFLEWIKSLENNKEKYQDKKISNTFKYEKQ